MEKLYITEEIANHEANKHLNLEVGALLRDPGEEDPTDDDGDDCPKEGQTQPSGPGRWTKSFGNCVWIPA